MYRIYIMNILQISRYLKKKNNILEPWLIICTRLLWNSFDLDNKDFDNLMITIKNHISDFNKCSFSESMRNISEIFYRLILFSI